MKENLYTTIMFLTQGEVINVIQNYCLFAKLMLDNKRSPKTTHKGERK